MIHQGDRSGCIYVQDNSSLLFLRSASGPPPRLSSFPRVPGLTLSFPLPENLNKLAVLDAIADIKLRMSIGKVNASVLGGLTQETTLALASVNFDFALCKMEAPTEYQGLGECLSRRRRDAAESGSEHILARKLGALFSHTLPATPKLVRAYGIRATEIIRETSNKQPKTLRDGAFREWTGPDATSIWAAATSGPGAIEAHLLACMLARIWPATEAEAIWEEIVQARKQEIAKSDQMTPLWPSQELAAKIEISKEQISRWDSSARAWLEVADNSRLKQQRQLELLIQDAATPVNQSEATYQSVMDAWRTALSTVEMLLEGIPQSVTNGSALLALTSWHLFPDMFVIGAGPGIISQHDPLYPKGTVITLGQSSRPPDAASDGVFWSLPLACLKYYGDPVVRVRSLGEGTSRLSFSEAMQVVLGSTLAGWNDYGQNFQQACLNIVSLADFLSRGRKAEPVHTRSWLHLLAEAAESYLAETGRSQSHIQSLTIRGHRRYKHLLWEASQTSPPLFGLSSLNTMLRLINVDDLENRISLLRLVAKSLERATHQNLVIRYRVPNEETEEHPFLGSMFASSKVRQGHDTDENEFEFSPPWDSKWTWEYATALERGQRNILKKRKYTSNADRDGHIRWTQREDLMSVNGEEIVQMTVPARVINSRCFQWDQHGSMGLRSSASDMQWVCILGNPEEAAIFKLSHSELAGSEELDPEIIDEAFRSDWINREKLINLLEFRGDFALPTNPQYLDCLRSLAAAADAYKLMPGATIATDLFSAPLKDALWMPTRSAEHWKTNLKERIGTNTEQMQSLMFGSTLDPRLLSKTEAADTRQNCDKADVRTQLEGRCVTGLRTYKLSRNQVFSCIAMFENRKVNLDPHILDQVMAVSAGGSIYVAMPLVCDPFDPVGPSEIKHVTGNISKPGLSLMIPPMAPKLRKVDENKWTLINNANFDGRMENSFQHTSLHLSFTGYQLPLMTAGHGYQGVEANFIETLVSVFDGHDWVADLDVLRALSMPSVSRLGDDFQQVCRHKKLRCIPQFQLTSIDSWDEFMDRPVNACIFRASGNWLARLSAVAVNAQQGLDTIVLEDGKKFCWECIGRMDKVQGKEAQKRLLFVG